MDHSKEVQHSEVRLLARQGNRHCDILRELHRLHGNHALSSTTIHCWMTATFMGRRNFETMKPVGRPPKLTAAVLCDIREATRQDPMITIRQLSRRFQLDQATVNKALRSVLKLKKRPCVMRPHSLNAANHCSRLQLSHHLLGKMRRSPRWASKVNHCG